MQNLLDIGLSETHNAVISGWRDKGRAAFCLPTPKTEEWKYTSMKPILSNIYQAPKPCSENHTTCTCEHKHEPHLPFEAYEICFHNGHLCAHQPHLPEGVTLLSLEEAAAEHETSAYLNKSFELDKMPFAALNTAHLGEGVFIRVARGIRLDKPLAFIYETDEDFPLWADFHNIIVLESETAVDWVELFESKNKTLTYAHNVVNEIFLGKSAVLKHYKKQQENEKAAHLAFNAVSVRQNARFESYVSELGALLARHETLVHLKEEGAETVLNAAYRTQGKTTHDTTANVIHACAQTTSKQLIKGVLEDEGHGVFQGKIRIEPKAFGANGTQLHKALMLSNQATVDVKPALEIFADDVKCSHGATSGALDENQLFYLRSRGIGQKEAEALLTKAFLDEPFATLPNEPIRLWLCAMKADSKLFLTSQDKK